MKSIRTKITVSITLLISILLIMLSVILSNIFSNSEKGLTISLSKEIVENRTNQMNEWFRSRKRELEIVSKSFRNSTIDEKNTRSFFDQNILSPYGEYEMFFVAGPDGEGWDSFDSGAHISDRSYFREIMLENKEFSISEPVISRNSGREVIIIAHAIKSDSGEKIGLIGATVLIETLTEIASSVSILDHGYGWLIDDLGDVIAHPDENIRMKKSIFDEDVADETERLSSITDFLKYGTTGEETLEYSYQGEGRIAIASKIAESPGWMLIVSIPEKDIYGETYEINNMIVWMMCLILFCTIVICILISGGISKPILEIAHKIESFGKGNLSTRIPIHGSDELAHISYTFNNMASSLQRALEKATEYGMEVEASNEELESANEELLANNEELESSYMTIESLAHEFEDMISLTSRLSYSAIKKDDEFLKDVLEIAVSMIPKADYGSISVVDENNVWRYIYTIGHDIDKLNSLELTSDSFEDWGESKIINDLNEYDRKTKDEKMIQVLDEATLPIKSSIISRMCVGTERLGGFALDISKDSAENFSFEDLRLVRAFSNMVTSFLALQKFLTQQENFQKDIIMSIISILEIYDPYTKGHSENVAFYSGIIAEKLGLEKDLVSRVYWTGLVHDIGKILVPPQILTKVEKLTEEEFGVIKNHPIWGAQVLGSSKGLKDMSVYVKHHHERWDGRGYPDGLAGEDIPLISRIITVADTYDAMTSDRPYRRALSKEAAMSELLKNRDLQFERKIVDIFIEILIKETD